MKRVVTRVLKHSWCIVTFPSHNNRWVDAFSIATGRPPAVALPVVGRVVPTIVWGWRRWFVPTICIPPVPWTSAQCSVNTSRRARVLTEFSFFWGFFSVHDSGALCCCFSLYLYTLLWIYVAVVQRMILSRSSFSSVFFFLSRSSVLLHFSSGEKNVFSHSPVFILDSSHREKNNSCLSDSAIQTFIKDHFLKYSHFAF